MDDEQLLNDIRINSTAKVMYLHLRRRPDTEPSMADLAQRTGVGITAATTALEQLEHFGWVTVDRSTQHDGDGRFLARTIVVHPEPISKRAIDITRQRAEQIRKWRVDRNLTWRSVAQAATAAWCDQVNTNQILGRDLCEQAAELLGEDPKGVPWN